MKMKRQYEGTHRTSRVLKRAERWSEKHYGRKLSALINAACEKRLREWGFPATRFQGPQP